ncbi:rhodanese-like domain-containing protein [Thiopseudomonas denitrificans]|uniref:Rhodanese-related sulfurtransferase n=1 Tax=Thiopseudomonas denitrificans TaxID=1501432 RepID=A0A4R6TWH5_9GAMM|nr:rhodanese-like domain-containing protein [Thiopseudomonas denitrificans]TDQ37082.1 rhodanese-related sulfurtransferase [Thiopseudomonas denitrificans]
MDRLIEFVGNHYLLSSAFVVLAIALLLYETRRSGKSLSSRELTSLVNADQAIVLDIRQGKDFSAGHIVDSVNIPRDKLAARIGELDRFRDKTIVVVCDSGMTAGPACTQLREAGFTAARLSGGINGWRGDNLPTVKAK